MSTRLYRGDDVVLTVTVTNPDDTAYDLSGKSLRFVAKSTYSEADTGAIVKTTAPSDGIEILDPPSQGLAKITLVPADLETLFVPNAIWVKLLWDLQIEVGTQNYTIAKGEFFVDADIGRSPA